MRAEYFRATTSASDCCSQYLNLASAERYSEECVRVVCRSTASSNSTLQQGDALFMITGENLVGGRIPLGWLGGPTSSRISTRYNMVYIQARLPIAGISRRKKRGIHKQARHVQTPQMEPARDYDHFVFFIEFACLTQ